ncbi:asparagine synthase-related protein [Novosphingobium sp. ZN18A2]|uniref:asparagine synthetase B family protein n=1 Tax=Novosphingobium sp. ZN18A2 TaxID=3079861 RepID=UPI0030CCA749
MSGIAAVIRVDGGDAGRATIGAMTGAMAYRGPDGIAHHVAGGAAIGHCMMRTTPESLTEYQPLGNEDSSVVLAIDGYLANRDELRGELRDCGARLRSPSDAELVLRAYERWGTDCPRHIDGEFAFVIWDARRREAFCARDHDGLRPLYYHHADGCLLVASDMAAIIAALPRQPEPNPGFITEILADAWYTSDETVWSGLMRLEPAHSLRFSGDRPGGGKLTTEEYWTIPLDLRVTYKRDEDYAEHYRAVLFDCVRRAARSNGALAFEVSGGLDSSSLFCVADRLLKAGALPAPGIAGLTLAGPTGSGADELEFVEAVERHLGRTVARQSLFQPPLQWFLDQARIDCDFPVYPNGPMAIGLARAAVEGGSRVIVSGSGGDNWLDGNTRYYREHLVMGDWAGLARSLRCDARNLGARRTAELFLRRGIAQLLPRRVRMALRPLGGARPVRPLQTHFWLSKAARENLTHRRERYERKLAAAPEHLRYKLATVKSPFNVLANEIMARQFARCGAEGRQPMLSRRFMEFSATTPEHTRLRGGLRKFTHRQSLRGILPAEIVNRTSKAYFDGTFHRHFDAIRLQCRTVDDARFGQLVNQSGIDRLLDEYCSTEIDDSSIWEIWGLFASSAFYSNTSVSVKD